MSRVAAVAARGPRPFSGRASGRSLAAVSVLLFAGSSALTVTWSTSMSEMGAMPMHGGAAMSMGWTGMSGLPWPGAMASFVGMWTVMMMAMMLPSLAPTLWHHHQTVEGRGVSRPGRQTMLVGVGYFAVWSAIGMAVFSLDSALGAAGMPLLTLARPAPLFTVGVVVLAAGAMQLTAWKAHQLSRCREASAPGRFMPSCAAAAWRHGLRLGVHCGLSCVGLMAIALAAGVMDLRVMALVTAAITAERLTPAGARVARGIGAVTIGLGLLLIARAAGAA